MQGLAMFSATCFVVLVIVRATTGCPTDPDGCAQCKSMLETVNNMVSAEMRDQLLQNVCEAFSVTNTDWCAALGQLSPTQLCQELGQCGSRVSIDDGGSVFNAEIEIPDSHLDGLPCMLCENVMKIAHAFLQTKEHQQYILKLLKSVCHFVPFLTKECVHLVDDYGTLVIHIASNYLSPELCKMFHICPAGQAAVFRDDCKMCKFGVGVIYDTVQDPGLDTRIQQYTREMCTEFVGVNEACDSMAQEVTQYLLPVAEELRHSNFFRHACQRANICSEDDEVMFE